MFPIRLVLLLVKYMLLDLLSDLKSLKATENWHRLSF